MRMTAVLAGTTDPAQPSGAAGLDGVQCFALVRAHAPAASLQVSRAETAHDLRQAG
jgi:hypothetical protein